MLWLKLTHVSKRGVGVYKPNLSNKMSVPCTSCFDSSLKKEFTKSRPMAMANNWCKFLMQVSQRGGKVELPNISWNTNIQSLHNDVIKWKHFPRYWPFCAGNSPVTGEFSSQRPVMRRIDVFFDLRLNKRLIKQSWGWWSETPSRSLWRHCNENSRTVIMHAFSSLVTPDVVGMTTFDATSNEKLALW